MISKRWATAITGFFYTLATLQIMAFYVMSTKFYLDLNSYFQGHERIPFQERILPAIFLWPMLQWPLLRNVFFHLHGIFLPPERGALFLLSVFSIAAAGYFCVKLYRELSPQRTLGYLVYPLFLYAVTWSYIVQVQQNLSYPYDMLSLVFFTAGLYTIYTRQFLPLFFIVLIGTLNRETTLFLIGLYIIDSATTAGTATVLRRRFAFSKIPWLKATLLFVVWAAIKFTLHHRFAHNNSENELRIHENLRYFGPKHWPALLNICGYLIPIVFLLRRQLRPHRFANYLLILPVWFGIMFLTGILLETRIWGELSSYAAIASVLLLEQCVDISGASIQLSQSRPLGD